MGYTQQQAADALGVTRDAVARWLSGNNPIERRTTLACAAIEAGLAENENAREA